MMSKQSLAMVNPRVNRAWYDVVKTPWLMKERVIIDYELLYVKEGTMHITIENQAYEAKPGELFLFRPGQRHSICVREEGRVIQPHIHFDLLQYDDREQWFVSFKNMDEMTEAERRLIRPDVMKELFPRFPARIKLTDQKYAEFLLFDVIQNFKNEQDVYRELQLKWSFLKFFTYLLRTYGYTESGFNAGQSTAAKIRTFLENNLQRPVHTQELAAVFHLDESYLGKLFRREFGISPIKYHQSERIMRSRDMLLYTNASVSDVAQRMGFSSVNDFSRAYKRQLGESPRESRGGKTGIDDSAKMMDKTDGIMDKQCKNEREK